MTAIAEAKIEALNTRIDEMQAVTEILKELSDDPAKDPRAICREREFDFSRFLDYAGDLDIVKGEINTIEDLGLSRAYWVLKRAGIKTVAELSQLTVSDILRIRNMGFRSAAEIVRALTNIGISIPEGPMNPEELRQWKAAISDRR